MSDGSNACLSGWPSWERQPWRATRRKPTRPGTTRRRITLGGSRLIPSVRLEVLDWEGSGPPLVLLGCCWSAHQHDEFALKTNQFHVYGITRRGIGASDKPAHAAVQRSADDLLEVLDSPSWRNLDNSARAGQVLTMFASQHSDRLSGLVYLDGASDPTTPPCDPPLPDPTTVPAVPVDTGARPQLVQCVHQTIRSEGHLSRS